MAISDTSQVSKAEIRRIQKPAQGSAFDPENRVWGFYSDGAVFDYGQFQAAEIATMLRRDGKARSVEQVLCQPIRGADWKIEPGDASAEAVTLCQDNLGTRLPTIIDQMTTAIAYRRAFFETTWTTDDGKVVYDEVALRPATGCEAGFDPRTGAPKGFRQRIIPVAGVFPTGFKEKMPGYALISPERSFVYTHGAYREPIKGTSDLDVAYWSFETKQKIMFLLCQFLENQSLPKTVVYGDDLDQATDLAQDVASLRSGGVLGLSRAEPGAKAFEVLESSGQGANQFMEFMRYLDTQMVASVLAGFTELAGSTTTGSYALSADQSEFFLSSRQAVADEIAQSIQDDLFGPLVRYNFGPDAKIPTMTIGPLSKVETQRALDMLKAVIVAPNLNVPATLVDQLTQSVAGYLGLDKEQVANSIAEHVKVRAEQDDLKAAQQKQLLANPIPAKAPLAGAAAVTSNLKPKPGAPPTPPKPSTTAKAPAPETVKLSRVVDVLDETVRRAQDGEDPATVLSELTDTE